jgi:hypothetical protein
VSAAKLAALTIIAGALLAVTVVYGVLRLYAG